MNPSNFIKRLIYPLRGWRSKRRIIVFESDDWGSIRTPNINSLRNIPTRYQSFYENAYNRYDTIASPHDIELIMDTLSEFHDFNGNYPIITANFIMSNPDFDRIRQDSYNNYYFERSSHTLKKIYGSKLLDLWKTALAEKILHPQLHGLVHLEVNEWMDKLRSNDPIYHDAFKRGIYSFNDSAKSIKKNLTAALDNNSISESIEKSKSISEACILFNKHFGYFADSFIAPSYTWDDKIEKVLFENSIKFIQGIRVQKIPTSHDRRYDYSFHYHGQKNELNQYYFVRNVFFEPTLNQNIDSVGAALKRIKLAFSLGMPAIICMHRLNLVGGLSIENRDGNLKCLSQLLEFILKKWPDVEFHTSSSLGNLMLKENLNLTKDIVQ